MLSKGLINTYFFKKKMLSEELLDICELDMATVVKVTELIKNGADVNFASDEATPLFGVIQSENEIVVKLLIEAGANVNLCCGPNISPLLYAIEWHNENIIQLLISKGAEINHANNESETVLFYACYYENKKLLQQLLPLSNIDFCDETGNTTLILCSQDENIENEFVEILLQANANVNLTNRNGHTALSLAVKNNNIEKVELLLQYGADTFIDSPLTTAIKRNYEEIIELLSCANFYILK